jgi:cation diffusion facilitator CzcD-associated flavoprotein CzcO
MARRSRHHRACQPYFWERYKVTKTQSKTQLDGHVQNPSPTDFDVIVIGAGLGGLRALHEFRKSGLSVKVIEAGADIGGVWHWNRYPGARTDSESWVYCFQFDQDLLQEWDWPERFPTQPQMLRYIEHVADRFDMRKDIQFNTYVKSAAYDEVTNRWTFVTDRGENFTAKFFVSAAGLLSVPMRPPFKGVDSFQGDWYVTGRWPKKPVDFTGKRVAIIGTGPTAAQAIPLIAQLAGHLTVFQRTPGFVLPARNHPLTDEERAAIKANYDAIWKQCEKQAFAFPIELAGRTFAEVTPEEQQRIFDRGWETGGFRFLFETFDDLFVNKTCNEAAAEFVRKKIRTLVKDPATAELLCPKGYPLGVKRPALGHYYYETFNRDNVTLVDVSSNPVEEITAKGLRTGTEEYEFDIIIFAIGFDPGASLTTMDVRGRGGQTLKEKWQAGARTYLGLAIDGFPNMFLIFGPQTLAGNAPHVHDKNVEWIAQAIIRLHDGGYDFMEAKPEAVDTFMRHNDELANRTIIGEGKHVSTWFYGSNVPGKEPTPLLYFGGAAGLFAEFADEARRDYPGFTRGRVSTTQSRSSQGNARRSGAG